MTRRVDTRLLLLEALSSEDEEIVLVDNRLEDQVFYISPDGDHHYLSDAEYQMMKARPNVTVITLEYVDNWRV
jgi:hypothetical protein